MHLCGKDYKYFSPQCWKCNSFGCIAAIRCGNACYGPYSDSLYSGSEHRKFNSPRLVKREAGFPKPRQVLIGSNHLWRVNDSPHYWELTRSHLHPDNKVHGANMGPIWGRQDPGGPHVDPMNFAIWAVQVMAWCQTWYKPLPEPMITQSTDIYESPILIWNVHVSAKCDHYFNSEHFDAVYSTMLYNTVFHEESII